MDKLRDTLKDERYFQKAIEQTESSIEKFETLISTVIETKGADDVGVRNGYNVLVSSYTKLVNLLYSAGEDIEIISNTYKKLLYYYGKMWKSDYGYFELIRILSMGVLLEIEPKHFAELEKKIVDEDFNDYLVNYLLIHIDNAWQLKSNTFVFPGIYDDLQVVIEQEDATAVQLLEEYLLKKWYSNHKDAAWYNSHKSKQDVYYGYWSYEAGAIVKCMGLDDSPLQNVKYYPYDLVHYKV